MKGLPNRLRRVFAATVLAAAALPAVLALGLTVPGVAQAQEKEVTIAYQQIVEPWLVAIASGEFEKATGYKIHWLQFESGAKVATAIAAGDIKIGVLGSSPMAAAVSQGLDLQLFWILDNISQAEAMVVRNASNIKTPADLKGKKIAVPFVSTSHYHTMLALQQWGIKPADVQVLNMQPNQIVAAWERGDIDAAYVWDPALAEIKRTGHVLISSADLAKEGKPTFDGIAVDRKWGEAHADFMAKFVKVIADTDAAYHQNPAAWTPSSPQVKAIVKMIGGKPEDVSSALSLYEYPTAQQQASSAWLGGGKDSGAAKALKDTAEFLKGQQRINTVMSDYSPYVTSSYVDAALKLK